MKKILALLAITSMIVGFVSCGEEKSVVIEKTQPKIETKKIQVQPKAKPNKEKKEEPRKDTTKTVKKPVEIEDASLDDDLTFPISNYMIFGLGESNVIPTQKPLNDKKLLDLYSIKSVETNNQNNYLLPKENIDTNAFEVLDKPETQDLNIFFAKMKPFRTEVSDLNYSNGSFAILNSFIMSRSSSLDIYNDCFTLEKEIAMNDKFNCYVDSDYVYILLDKRFAKTNRKTGKCEWIFEYPAEENYYSVLFYNDHFFYTLGSWLVVHNKNTGKLIFKYNIFDNAVLKKLKSSFFDQQDISFTVYPEIKNNTLYTMIMLEQSSKSKYLIQSFNLKNGVLISQYAYEPDSSIGNLKYCGMVSEKAIYFDKINELTLIFDGNKLSKRVLEFNIENIKRIEDKYCFETNKGIYIGTSLDSITTKYIDCKFLASSGKYLMLSKKIDENKSHTLLIDTVTEKQIWKIDLSLVNASICFGSNYIFSGKKKGIHIINLINGEYKNTNLLPNTRVLKLVDGRLYVMTHEYSIYNCGFSAGIYCLVGKPRKPFVKTSTNIIQVDIEKNTKSSLAITNTSSETLNLQLSLIPGYYRPNSEEIASVQNLFEFEKKMTLLPGETKKIVIKAKEKIYPQVLWLDIKGARNYMRVIIQTNPCYASEI